jgi:hypothetical protein
MHATTAHNLATGLSTSQPARPRPSHLVTVLTVVAGTFLVLLCSYIPTILVGATADIRSGAAMMVTFFSLVLLVTVGAIGLALRGARWRAAAQAGLGTAGRGGVQRVMYFVAGSGGLLIVYGVTLAFNPSADWRYGIYLITTVFPMLLIAILALIGLGRGSLWGKVLARTAVITWPLAFLLFGNLPGLAYGLLILGLGLWAIHGLHSNPLSQSAEP